MRNLQDTLDELKSDFTKTVKCFDNIKGIKHEDYVELYNKYLYHLKDTSAKICELMGYHIHDRYSGTYYITDLRCGTNVRSSSGLRMPSYWRQDKESQYKLVNYQCSYHVSIYFILELLELEMPREIQDKIDYAEKNEK